MFLYQYTFLPNMIWETLCRILTFQLCCFVTAEIEFKDKAKVPFHIKYINAYIFNIKDLKKNCDSCHSFFMLLFILCEFANLNHMQIKCV